MQWTLEAMRINKGLTQAELAEKFEVSSQTIARLEKDSSDIGYQLLKKYMFFFNVKFDDIFLGKKYENFVKTRNKKAPNDSQALEERYIMNELERTALNEILRTVTYIAEKKERRERDDKKRI